MGRVIPNENSFIGFVPEGDPNFPVDFNTPTEGEIAAAVDVTCFVSSITASAQGNTIPTPSLCSLFETSVPGTSQATFQGDFYRDDDDTTPDEAWNLLPRNTKGIFYISRFGGTGTDYRPTAGEPVEAWPVHVTSRAAGPLSSNTPQTFSITCAINEEPAENATVQVGVLMSVDADKSKSSK